MNNKNKNSHPNENYKTPLIFALNNESQADEIRIFHWIILSERYTAKRYTGNPGCSCRHEL